MCPKRTWNNLLLPPTTIAMDVVDTLNQILLERVQNVLWIDIVGLFKIRHRTIRSTFHSSPDGKARLSPPVGWTWVGCLALTTQTVTGQRPVTPSEKHGLLCAFVLAPASFLTFAKVNPDLPQTDTFFRGGNWMGEETERTPRSRMSKIEHPGQNHDGQKRSQMRSCSLGNTWHRYQPLDSNGHHRTACPVAGVLGIRGFAMESTTTRMCRERVDGSRPTSGSRTWTTDPRRRLALVPRGANVDGHTGLWPRCADVDGAT